LYPSWIKTGGGQLSSPLTFSNVRKQILWGNRFITFEKKKLFFKEWINSGIFFVKKISHIFPNTFKYFSGINFQFENFESANLLTHDAFKDIK
jgi:hypothetical protein